MRRPILQTLPRDGRADFLRSFYTRSHSGGTAFCAGQPDQLYPVTAVSCLFFIHLHMLWSWRVYFLHRPRPETCAGNGRPITRRPFHTFVLRKKLFLHRPNSGTLPGIGGSQLSAHFTHGARPSISHVFALENFFPAQGQPVNFTRRRPFPRRPFILHIFFFWRGSFLHRPSSSTAPRDGHPPAHSFISPRFCSGENFFSPEQPINFNRWGSFVPAAPSTLPLHLLFRSTLSTTTYVSSAHHPFRPTCLRFASGDHRRTILLGYGSRHTSQTLPIANIAHRFGLAALGPTHIYL